MSKARLLAAGAFLLLAAGCSSGASSPTATPVASSAAPTPSSSSSAAAPCPAGSYLLTAFEGRGAASAAGKGTGGNIGADFTDGTFTISSDGSSPMRLQIGSASAELRLDGAITGTYVGDPAALQLTTTGARGDASIKSLGFSRSYSADQLAGQLIGSSTSAQATCDDAAGTTVLDLPNAKLTLTRR